MRPGEYNNKLADEDGAMIHPWVRMAGTGYHAEEAGDPATVRQMRVALRQGRTASPDSRGETPTGTASPTSTTTSVPTTTSSSESSPAFASEDPSFTRITEDDWGEREPMDWAESEVEISPEGRLLGAPTGRAGVRATCEGLKPRSRTSSSSSPRLVQRPELSGPVAREGPAGRER